MTLASWMSLTASESGLFARSGEQKRRLERLQEIIAERQSRVVERDSRRGRIYVIFPEPREAGSVEGIVGGGSG